MIQEAYIQGISTRPVDDLVRAMGMEGVSKSQVSRLCGEIDDLIQDFLTRPIEGDWLYLWLDATYVMVRCSCWMETPHNRWLKIPQFGATAPAWPQDAPRHWWSGRWSTSGNLS